MRDEAFRNGTEWTNVQEDCLRDLVAGMETKATWSVPAQASWMGLSEWEEALGAPKEAESSVFVGR